MRDYILFDYRPGMMGMLSSRAQNIDARIMGGELGAAHQFAPNWKADATLAYAWARTAAMARRCRRCRRWKAAWA